MVSFCTHLLEIGTSTLRFENMEELLKVRYDLLFSSALASSSCLITIIETNGDDRVLDVIGIVNEIRVERKHVLLIVPTFNEDNFKNITTNYEVTIDHQDKGKYRRGDMNLHVKKTFLISQMVVGYSVYVPNWARIMH